MTKKKSLWVSLSPIVTSIWFYQEWVTFIGSNWIATREHSLWYQFSFAFRLKTATVLCRLQYSYLFYLSVILYSFDTEVEVVNFWKWLNRNLCLYRKLLHKCSKEDNRFANGQFLALTRSHECTCTMRPCGKASKSHSSRGLSGISKYVCWIPNSNSYFLS